MKWYKDKPKSQTNFQRVASNEEALAEFISDIVYECREGNRYEELEGCSVCNLHWCSKQDVLAWLKQDSE